MIKKCTLFFLTIFFIQSALFSQIQVCPNGSPILAAGKTGTVYQWQQNTGSGFSNLTDGSHYSGSGGPSMQLINVPTSWYGYQYRCLVDGVAGATSTLQFVTIWVGITENWSSAKNWSCGSVPDSSTDVIINSSDGDIVIVDQNAFCRSLTLNQNASVEVDPGVKLTIAH